MPSPGLALIGFLDRDKAVHFLETACVPDPAHGRSDLEQQWIDAKARLGQATANAGHPDIQPIPNEHVGHIQSLTSAQWVQDAFQGQSVSFQLVEIDPLLAYQVHVDTDRTDHHCNGFSSPPTVSEMLPVCLPLTPPSENIQIIQYPQSVVLRSRSLNFGARLQGMLNNEAAGLVFNLSLPLLHVVRFNGRCYLHNGFHRTFGMRRAGATHAPCVVRDVNSAAAAGIKTDGSTFDQQLLESADPPTIAHFTQGKAHDVQIRRTARILHVSWAEYVMPEE